ncbi:hypothetical protein GCM10017764_32170 [Sphingobacterium griseoflavum]|uniref:LTD domain-containing protein n=2 Tax=Sphingobacterium griseoflavum TaxID=1474952 RepID=A0ABQ3I1W6_9SPHI|nr:hypothetical protein GCM10017764_32170 [Sphingobacterium griseoflavum]
MPHPLPTAFLDSEYIEIYNNSSQVITLQHYTLQVGNFRVPLADYYLAPGQYMLLVDAAVAPKFARFGNVMPLRSWRALQNVAGSVSLLDKGHNVVDHVLYSNAWYELREKKNGGWSLERINPNLACNNSNTWRASEARNGGTPGQRNSVWNAQYNPTITFPSLQITDSRIVLHFASPTDGITFGNDTRIVFEPAENSIVRYELSTDSLVLYTDRPIKWDEPTEIRLQDILYCGQLTTTAVSIFRASPTRYNDLVVNEVLFDPKAGGDDFVELYNRSGRIINLRGWQIGQHTISSEDHFIEVGGYRALTTSPDRLQQDYPHSVRENMIAMQALPAYPNTRGTVLLSKNSTLVDSLFYQSTMHQPFLANVRGISLERQSSEEDTNSKGNFSSASTLVGGATPGYRNSTDVEKKVKKNSWWLDRKTFSPSGNGSESRLVFNYAFSERNPMLNLTIYDSNGRVVNRLIRNKSAGLAGEVIWDGRNEQGTLCPAGIYIYQSEIHTSEGHYQQFKGSFVLIHAGK